MQKAAVLHISVIPDPMPSLRVFGVLCGARHPSAILAHSHVGTEPERECIRCRSIFDARRTRHLREWWAQRAYVSTLTHLAAWYFPFCDAAELAQVMAFWAAYLSEYAPRTKSA